MTTVAVVDSAAGADALRDEWARLAAECGAGPLLHPDHLLTWWRHLGRGRLLLVTVREGDRLVVLAPLHERRVGPARAVRWLGHGVGTVAHLLVAPGHEERADLVWQELAGGRRVWQLVETRADVPGTPRPGSGPGRGRLTTVVPRDVCPYADLTGGLDAFAHGPGMKNFRRLAKRWDRLVAEAGLVFRADVATDLASFEAHLPDIRLVTDLAEADRERLHLLRPPYDGYHLDYVRTLLAQGRACSVVGYLDDTPVGFQLLLRDGSLVSLWTARNHPGFAALSPGHLVQRAAFGWAESQGVTRVDLLLGGSQMKRLWATGSYDTLEVQSGHRWARLLVDTGESLAARVRGRRR